MALLLDRTRRQARRHHPELDRNVQAPRHRSIHLLGRCAAADQRTSLEPRRRTHPAPVETALRREPHAFRDSRLPGLINYAAWLPLTGERLADWSSMARGPP